MDAQPRRVRIALLPLDERPVNVQLPGDVASMAGAELLTPPAAILPHYRSPGHTEALAAWLHDQARDPSLTHVVVSLDLLCYGGLIPARTSSDDVETVLGRLAVLREIKALRPDLVIFAVSLIMRASDSYSSVEEPDYWALYGRNLHALGAAVHRRDGGVEIDPATSMTDAPAEIIADLARRRLRNHLVNLTAIELHASRVIDFLAITADDTAVYSYGSAEQAWVRHWLRLFPAGRRVLTYPGADEVGAVLVARALAQQAGATITVATVCPDPDGMARVAPFENAPLSEAVARHILAAGAEAAVGPADITVVIHAPDPDRKDQAGAAAPTPDEDAAEQTCAAVAGALDAGRTVAVADVRYSNGADPLLVEKLIARGLLGRLTAFGAWNTAGNTLGSVIATAVAAVAGSGTERSDAEARPRALVRRVLDDYAFQSVVRHRGDPAVFAGIFPILPADQAAQAAAWVTTELRALLAADLPFPEWQIASVMLPWNRGFEVDIELEHRPRQSGSEAGACALLSR